MEDKRMQVMTILQDYFCRDTPLDVATDSILRLLGVSDSKLYTRDEVIRLLEDLYEEVAYSYNDYGRTDFSKEAVEYVKTYMNGK